VRVEKEGEGRTIACRICAPKGERGREDRWVSARVQAEVDRASERTNGEEHDAPGEEDVASLRTVPERADDQGEDDANVKFGEDLVDDLTRSKERIWERKRFVRITRTEVPCR
jgi:hypothetical protein